MKVPFSYYCLETIPADWEDAEKHYVYKLNHIYIFLKIAQTVWYGHYDDDYLADICGCCLRKSN